MQTPKDHDWLPLPSGLSRRSHHSFTKELLCRFDKLYQPEIAIDQCSLQSVESSCSIPSVIEPIKINRRYRSAGDLLRKSSVYLKNKFYHDPSKLKTKKSSLYPQSVMQYPPKPLVYQPIQPILEEKMPSKTLHRLSMPLLKLTQHDPTIHRRQSDSNLLNTTHTSVLHTMSQQWHKLILKLKRS
ncbi:hypothetical protein BD560DRAFT_490389 [Blakeslea trispora]|nr:hypothetical protein BD560DRAFT_490389 [Blakeslea trispora]